MSDDSKEVTGDFLDGSELIFKGRVFFRELLNTSASCDDDL